MSALEALFLSASLAFGVTAFCFWWGAQLLCLYCLLMEKAGGSLFATRAVLGSAWIRTEA